MGSKIRQVTHINSYAEEEAAADKDPISPSALLTKLASGEAPKEVGGFIKNPKIVKSEALELKNKLERFRGRLDASARQAQAEEMKAAANGYFSAGQWSVSLVGYFTGIWFLRQGNPPCPTLVASALSSGRADYPEFKSGIAEAAAMLAAAAATAPADSEGSDAVETTLRTSLHLNMAAAALKLFHWVVAKAACEFVLAVEDANPKALFRLAKALEGEGDLSRGVSVVLMLLKRDSQNADARRLLEALRKRQTEEKGMFKGMFEDQRGGASDAPAASVSVSAANAAFWPY